MPLEQANCYCHTCQGSVLAQRQGVNHLVHGIVTVLFCGLWLPIWLIAAATKGPYRCQRCGSKISLYKNPPR